MQKLQLPGHCTAVVPHLKLVGVGGGAPKLVVVVEEGRTDVVEDLGPMKVDEDTDWRILAEVDEDRRGPQLAGRRTVLWQLQKSRSSSNRGAGVAWGADAPVLPHGHIFEL